MQKHFLVLYAPLIISNILHMFIVKHNFLAFLKKPIALNFFGENKTVRGFIFVPLTNAFILSSITFLFSVDLKINGFVLGLLLGLSYLMLELPNSYFKRRIGIAPGKKSDRYRNIFIILDRCDSAFGVSLLYVLIHGLTSKDFIILFGLAFSIHFIFSYLMVKVGVKQSL